MRHKDRKTKLDRYMIEYKVGLDELHEETNLANPSLLHIKKGRKIAITEFRKRTLIDLEKNIGVPPQDFLGWEGGNLTQADFKAPENKFRVVGMDLLKSEDWFEDFATEKGALTRAEKKKDEMMRTYVYDDKGKRVDSIEEESGEVEDVEKKLEVSDEEVTGEVKDENDDKI